MTIRFTNLPQFEGKLKQLSKKAQIDMDTVLRRVALEIFTGVVKRTPVDTGYARANWKIARVVPDVSTLPEGSESYASPPKPPIPKADPPSTIYVTNSLPYIVPLEKGHSQQAGKGFMVQRTVNDVFANIDRALEKLMKGLAHSMMPLRLRFTLWLLPDYQDRIVRHWLARMDPADRRAFAQACMQDIRAIERAERGGSV